MTEPTAADAGEWLDRPPTKPGFYWYRLKTEQPHMARPMQVYWLANELRSNFLRYGEFDRLGAVSGRWWSVPIRWQDQQQPTIEWQMVEQPVGPTNHYTAGIRAITYVATDADDSSLSAVGSSPAEAVGNLIRQQPGRFRLTVRRAADSELSSIP